MRMALTVVVLLAGLMFALCGCSMFEPPKVKAPKGLSVPAGTPVTVEQLQALSEEAKATQQAEEDAEQWEAARSIRRLEREAKSKGEEVAAEAVDQAEEIAAAYKRNSAARSIAVKSIDASFAAAKADVAARQDLLSSAIGTGTQVLGTVAPLIPGGGLIMGAITAAAGLFGASQRARANREAARASAAEGYHENHVDAIDHAADVYPELRRLLDQAKPLIAEWQTPGSQQVVKKYSVGV